MGLDFNCLFNFCVLIGKSFNIYIYILCLVFLLFFFNKSRDSLVVVGSEVGVLGS